MIDRRILNVGMGMPQLGEFSLAIGKVGVEQGAIGAFVNPVITVATAITALLYPFIFRSAHATANLLNRRSPTLLKQYGESLYFLLAALRSSFQFKTDRARRIQRSVWLMLLNLGIIVVLITIGTGLLQFTPQLSRLLPLRESLLGLVVGGGVLALCVPPAVAIWRALLTLSDGIAEYVVASDDDSSDAGLRRNIRVVLRDSILILILILPGIWSIPLISRLLTLGALSAPVPIILLVVLSAGLTLAAFQIHGVLEATFSRTFLGTDNPHYDYEEPEDRFSQDDDDAHLHTTDNLDPERSEVQH